MKLRTADMDRHMPLLLTKVPSWNAAGPTVLGTPPVLLPYEIAGRSSWHSRVDRTDHREALGRHLPQRGTHRREAMRWVELRLDIAVVSAAIAWADAALPRCMAGQAALFNAGMYVRRGGSADS